MKQQETAQVTARDFASLIAFIVGVFAVIWIGISLGEAVQETQRQSCPLLESALEQLSDGDGADNATTEEACLNRVESAGWFYRIFGLGMSTICCVGMLMTFVAIRFIFFGGKRQDN